MNKNTGIRIEAIREVSDTGEKGFRITHVKALKRENLPELYATGGKETVCERTGYRIPGLLFHRKSDRYPYGQTISVKSCDGLIVDHFVSTLQMAEALAHIRAAGQHLTEVNDYLRTKRESWNGKVVFVDGEEIPPNAETKENAPIEIADRIVKLWAEGRLLFRSAKGQIEPLKPLTK